jgi:hypothetical protein
VQLAVHEHWIAGAAAGGLVVQVVVILARLARRGHWLPALGTVAIVTGATGGLIGYGVSDTDASVYTGLACGTLLGSSFVIFRRRWRGVVSWVLWWPWWLAGWIWRRIDPTVNSYQRLPWWFAVGGFLVTWLPMPSGYPFTRPPRPSWWWGREPHHGPTFIWLAAVVLTTAVCVLGAAWFYCMARMIFGWIWKDGRQQGLLLDDETVSGPRQPRAPA